VSRPVNKRKPLTIQIGNLTANGFTSLVMGIAIANFPWLAWGPIDNILSAILKKGYHALFEGGTVLLNKIVIEVDVNVDVTGMEKALENGHKNPGKETDLEIKKSMCDLVRYGRAIA